MNKKITVDQVKKIYEAKFGVEVTVHDWSSPELVAKYIEKYRLYSSSAEIIFSLLNMKVQKQC